MNRASLPLAVALCLGSSLAPAQDTLPPAASPPLKTTVDQASYAIGLNIGRNLTRDGLTINTDAVIRGLTDALKNARPALTDEQCRAALEALDRQFQEQMAQKAKVEGDKNRREGQAFLAANKQKQGVVTLPSGLQYSVVKSGMGPTPAMGDTVRTHYQGTFIDGKVFDSSLGGEPAVFPVDGVIRGWTEALKMMKVGDKWKLYVPAELAYGPNGSPPVIGPHAVLIFDLELLGVEKRP